MSSRPVGSGFGPRQLAEAATRRPRRVLLIWGLVVVVSFVLIGALLPSAITSENSLTNNPESTQAQDLIDERLPDEHAVDELIVVRSENATISDPAFEHRIETLVADARKTGSVAAVQTPLQPGTEALVSRDRHAAIVAIVLKEKKDERIDDLVPVVEAANGQGGFAVSITGENTLGRDFTKVSGEDLSNGELRFGLPAALIVLLLVFGTLTGAAIPMLMAIISIIVALAITSVVGQLWQLNLFITNMVVAMGLALGIDYSLFIVSRLREERKQGKSTRDAILVVAGTATRAVVFSGTAFTLAMIGMLLVPDTTLRSLGFGAVAVGVVSVAVALTFHPAVLMVLGDRVDKTRLPWIGKRVADAAGEEGPLWRRAVMAVMRRPAIYLAATALVMLALAVPLLGLQMGSSGGSSLPDDSIAKKGLIALERDFSEGATNPVKIVIDGPADDAQLAGGLKRLRATLAKDRDFASPALFVTKGPNITVASVPLTTEPTSEQASAAVERLRSRYIPIAFGAEAGEVLVGGGPAEAVDSFAVSSDWLPLVIAFVLALTLVLLTVAFRSIVIPLTAIAVNLLSVGAAYGILVLVFQKGVASGVLGFDEVERIESWVPIFLFSVLFGLSMDYQVFLLSRIQERWAASGDTGDAIVHGVASTARLITGAAAIIIVVFAGFASGQLVSFQQMGFGIAIALAIDATLVRLVLIPAAMRLLGDRNWYLPRGLGWLPHLEIEGPSADRTEPATPR